MVDDPNTQLPTTTVYAQGGGAEIYTYDFQFMTFLPDPQSHATLVKMGSNYERHLPDGSVQFFTKSDGASAYPHKIFMTDTLDPAGNHIGITYDSSLRITKITDAVGQETHFFYELVSDPLKITKVADPFGVRFATFAYETTGTNPKLTTITDEIGIQSQFGYQADTDSINTLTTPYGTTTFQYGISGTNRWIETLDPLGGRERVEYRDNAPGIAATDPANTVPSGFTNASLNIANTFYWDKKALSMFPPVNGVYDYTKAQVKHWLYNANGSVSGILSSEKKALEYRVWYAYLGQPDYQHVGPSANRSKVARVLGDGTTQLSQYEYNSVGKTTKTTDPAGRVMSYIYDSTQIDLLEIRQTTGGSNELVRQFGDYYLHQPRTEIDAAGQPTYFTFNTFGQILTRTNAKNEQTTYAYGNGISVPLGFLASITSPNFNSNNAVISFGYDSFHRVRTVTTKPDEYTVTTDYDNLDRKTVVTYPDGTHEDFQYTQDFGQGVTTILDLTRSRDRLGQWTTRHYNRNRQMDSITDPDTRTTLYGWCICGSLTSITEPNGNLTTVNRDLQSRVYQKVYADGTAINYLFEGQTAPNTAGAISRLKSATDALGRRTNYSYFADNNLSQVSYTNSLGGQLTPPTPTVTLTYNSNYNRIASMTDGTGLTTYDYYPIDALPALGAGMLRSIDGPLGNDTVSFAYDKLGRKIEQSVDGLAETMDYDTLGRLTTTTNALGSFVRSYDGVTPRLLTLTYPNSQTANYTYFGNTQDRRLQTLQNLTNGSANLSKFDYTYDAEGQILTWNRQLGTVTSGRWFDYDAARQLLSARNASTPGASTEINSYVYDSQSNRTADSNSGTASGHEYTLSKVNSIDSITNEQGQFTWTEYPSYDLAGNLTDNAEGKTFEWDAANRLTAINSGNLRSEFTYDGLSRRVKIVEKTGPTVTSTKQYVWIGNRIAQERDASNSIKKHYFGDGEVRGVPGTKTAKYYYYTRDHLGSIREVTSGGGIVEVRYDYDPYGLASKIAGTLDVDFGYTGHYFHAPSSLSLTLYRAYNPTLGRWLSRDPIGEREGSNLYRYVHNDPINVVDPFGLFPWHGNWGGPNWANGEVLSEMGRLPGPGDWEFKPPTDSRDYCYLRHDQQISHCYNCGFFDANCVRNADHELARCLRMLPSEDRTWKVKLEAWLFDTLIPTLLH